MRRSVRIALIDDQPFFQMDNLRSNQFDVFLIGNITNIDQVSGYDVIACDLRGVGVALNERLQGAALMKEIKRLYPDKYIIAYSGSFARSVMVDTALDVSDDHISKSADLDQWMQTLDQSITSVTDPVERWNRIRLRMVQSNIDTREFYKAEDIYVRSILQKNKSKLEKFTARTELTSELRTVLRSLITSAIWLAITHS